MILYGSMADPTRLKKTPNAHFISREEKLLLRVTCTVLCRLWISILDIRSNIGDHHFNGYNVSRRNYIE